MTFSWIMVCRIDRKPQFRGILFMYLFISQAWRLPLPERLALPVRYPLYGSGEGG